VLSRLRWAVSSKNRKKSTLLSVDNHYQAQAQNGDGIGSLIPDPLRKRWEYENADIIEFVSSTRRKFDIIFEDGFHDPEQVATVWQHGTGLLKPGGVLVTSHFSWLPRMVSRSAHMVFVTLMKCSMHIPKTLSESKSFAAPAAPFGDPMHYMV